MKWADYVIAEVRYQLEKRHINQVKAMSDNGETLGSEIVFSRQDVIALLNRGQTFVTAYKKEGKFQKGDKVEPIVINNTRFIRTNGDKIEEDNLGELPEF